jgi:hypothetical protein
MPQFRQVGTPEGKPEQEDGESYAECLFEQAA